MKRQQDNNRPIHAISYIHIIIVYNLVGTNPVQISPHPVSSSSDAAPLPKKAHPVAKPPVLAHTVADTNPLTKNHMSHDHLTAQAIDLEDRVVNAEEALVEEVEEAHLVTEEEEEEACRY